MSNAQLPQLPPEITEQTIPDYRGTLRDVISLCRNHRYSVLAQHNQPLSPVYNIQHTLEELCNYPGRKLIFTNADFHTLTEEQIRITPGFRAETVKHIADSFKGNPNYNDE